MATASTPQAPPPPAPPPPDLKILWIRLALFVSVIGVLGSLHLSLNMGLKACPLCYYQRAFIMAAAGLLAFGMFLPGMPTAAVSVLALIPASAGFCIAVEHVRLELIGSLECPLGISGFLIAPQESLIIFATVVAALVGDLLHRKVYVMQGLGALLLGLVFCTTGIRSTSAPPPEPPDSELKGCRKPVPKR
jgi:hypothetical protein